ncbi:hypothetical protein [Pollutibacter soli]|uniref:hypothetical protein n=1 Tax=Pollutibacter soli TaxID=3034157 RepID=UPI0030140FB1
MSTTQQNLEALRDIRKMMERSSRFISLSGWSGIAAGTCALIGAGVALQRIRDFYNKEIQSPDACMECLQKDLITIAALVLIGATVTAFFFTFLRSKREGVPIWGTAARRLVWNTLLPMAAGGFIILKLLDVQQYEMIAGSSLIIYGLALVNGSKYTLGEIRFLGYAEILLGIISLWLTPQNGIYFWAVGFGVMHILYGVAMWWKYERKTNS